MIFLKKYEESKITKKQSTKYEDQRNFIEVSSRLCYATCVTVARGVGISSSTAILNSN